MEVDLSRLDSMIRTEKEVLAKLQTERISGANLVFALKIYARTSDDDMEKAKARALAAREDFYDAVALSRKRLAYIAYLSEARDAANNRCGVGDRLLEKAALDRTIAFLQNVLSEARFGAGAGVAYATTVSELKDPDYYKSAFTEKCRTEDITMTALSQDDVKYFLTLRDDAEKMRRVCMDELAQINKHEKTEIMDFEEFAARSKA